MNKKQINYENKLVEKFNRLFKKGDKVLWKSNTFSEPRELTVASEAFMGFCGSAVVFFEGVSGYCSIDNEFVSYPKIVKASS